jgi:UDP-N-acetylglucosamine diphosphorylase/glucosamine-1-phosphate N-acetyltransferase
MTTAAIILAAGKGTRMKSDLPKVLHPVCGRPMLSYALDACQQAGCGRLICVVGHRADLVRQGFAHLNSHIRWVVQEPQLGTGHAAMVCRDELAKLDGPVLVLAGDGPLIRPATLRKLIDTHVTSGAACTLGTAILDNPGRYGRIVRDASGELAGIVEALDATAEQRSIREVNVSLYCFDAAALLGVLDQLTNHNAKGEYYLTDALALIRQGGGKLAAVPAMPAQDVVSINTLDELAQVERVMRRRGGAA